MHHRHRPRPFRLCTLALTLLLGCSDSTGSAQADQSTPPDQIPELSDTQDADAAPELELSPDAEETRDTEDDTRDQQDATELDSSEQDEPDEQEPPMPLYQSCTSSPEPSLSPQGFRHLSSELLVGVANPEHSAQDVIALPSSRTQIPGKFAYGRFSKDLQDEEIIAFLDDCSGFSELGRALTDSDGRVSFELDTTPLGLGRFALHQAVTGDASGAPSELRVLPAGTQLIVLDIDGTLTTSDSEVLQDTIDEFFLPIYEGSYLPEAYPGAIALTQALADKGYVLVYLTGRPYWLTRITREWLQELGFAPGHLHLTDSNGEALPTEGGVGSYKRDYLLGLLAMGYTIEYAYGNATTDIWAFEQAGIDKSKTFIIGDHAGEEGTQGIAGDYLLHLAAVQALPQALQPFAWP
jgi:hypothetical protein